MTQRVRNATLIVALTIVGMLAVARTPATAASDTGVIRGTIFFDDNENFQWDDGEPGMPNVRVYFEGTVKGEVRGYTINTQAGGGFTFEGRLTEWTITVKPPEGYRFPENFPEEKLEYELETDGQEIIGVDLPLVRAIARVKGRVYYDENDNDSFDTDEEGAGDVEMRFTMDGWSETVETWEDGTYQAYLRVGTWSITVVPPSGYQEPGPHKVTLETADDEAQALIGLPPLPEQAALPAEPGPAPISAPAPQSVGVGFIRGTVFHDADGDGQLGEDEEGLGGATLTFRTGDAEHSISSRDDGSYAFSGSTTTWLISVTAPEGYAASEAPREVNIPGAGEEVTGVDFPLLAADEEGKALPASGSTLAPGVIVGALVALLGVGLALTLIGERSRRKSGS